jgi:hypothetical protein
MGGMQLKVVVRFQGDGKGVSRIVWRTEGFGRGQLSVVSHGGGRCVQ